MTTQPRSHVIGQKYLFENIDTRLLKADEEFIKKIYKEMRIQREAQSKKREQFENNPPLKPRKVRVRRRSKKPSDVKADMSPSAAAAVGDRDG